MTGRNPSIDPARSGFTLVELMVVIAIVGVLTAIAVVYVSPSARAATARGYAEEVAAFLDATRERAIASHAWQRLTVTGAGVKVRQASITGFVAPADDDDCPPGPIDPLLPSCWIAVGNLSRPSGDVAVRSTAASPHIDPGSAPAVGAGLPLYLDVAPDGGTTGSTLFVSDDGDDGRARVVVFGVTGAVIVYDRW